MNGILLVDKPADWTSNDVVQKLRGVLRERRIGHAGTLDPMATGLLTVFVGRATRAVEFAENSRKRYRAGLRLGLVTDTQDISGRVLESRENGTGIGEEEILQVLKQFTGPQQQIPPMYSAVKVNGQRLYKLARKGEEVERKPREITVFDLQLLGRDGEDLLLDIVCSKGSYVRTLCHDIGNTLGCGGCMSSLRRLEAGPFHVEQANRLEDIQEGRYQLLPVDLLFDGAPALTLDAENEKRLRNGQPLPSGLGVKGFASGTVRLYSENREFLALASSEAGNLRVIKSFYEV